MEPNPENTHDNSMVREIRVCSVCGIKFSAVGEHDPCPVCLLRDALGEGEPKGPLSEHTRSTEAARRFEHYEVALNADGQPLELGRGAMGVTYKAFDVDLRCPVTLKVINEKYLGDEAARQRFLREARAAASVRHPNVTSVLPLRQEGKGLPLRNGVCGGGNSRQAHQALRSA
jgi:hypothetical protein